MQLFKEPHLVISELILMLYFNIIIRGNTFTLQKQKEIFLFYFSSDIFRSFSEDIKVACIVDIKLILMD